MEAYKSGWQSIVKPKTFPYDEFDLGPNLQTNKFRPELTIKRHEFEVINSKSLILKCSFFHIDKSSKEARNPLKPRKERMDHSDKPCIIYCHSHSANRLEGSPIVHHALPYFNLCVFDFSGCGHSEGEWVTLGLKEFQDIKAVMGYLEVEMSITNFFLWGRSMGAVSCLLFLAEEAETGGDKYAFGEGREVHAVAYDSPFTDSREMVRNCILSTNF